MSYKTQYSTFPCSPLGSLCKNKSFIKAKSLGDKEREACEPRL